MCLAAWHWLQVSLCLSEYSRRLLIGCRDGCLPLGTSRWQPVQPMTWCTDCPKSSPETCRNIVSPSSSAFFSFLLWHLRHLASGSLAVTSSAEVAGATARKAVATRRLIHTTRIFIICIRSFY